jgi:hypothetical protein
MWPEIFFALVFYSAGLVTGPLVLFILLKLLLKLVKRRIPR